MENLLASWGIAESVLLGIIGLMKFGYNQMEKRLEKSDERSAKWEEKFRNNEAVLFGELTKVKVDTAYLKGIEVGRNTANQSD